MVLTQPDRPAGRGMKLRASPVKQLALKHDLRIYQPASLKSEEVQANIAAVQCDVMIVAAYGLIIPTSVLNMPNKDVTTFMGHYCQGGAVLLRFIERFWLVMRKRVSLLWRLYQNWMLVRW